MRDRIARAVGVYALALAAACAGAQDFRPEHEKAASALSRGDEMTFRSILEPLAATGDERAALLLGQFHNLRGRPIESERLLISLARQGNAEAQYHLAGSFFLRQRSEEGHLWLEKSAAQGYPKALVVKRNLDREPKAVNGRVRVQDYGSLIEGAIQDKQATLSDTKIACYKQSREALLVGYKRAVASCLDATRKIFGDSVREEEGVRVVREVATCANAEVLSRAGISTQELAQCLGP